MDDSRLFERTVSSAIQYSGPVFDVYSDTVELCNKKTARRDYLKHRGAVAVVPLTDNGGVIIERQFRYPQQRVMTEISLWAYTYPPPPYFRSVYTCTLPGA